MVNVPDPNSVVEYVEAWQKFCDTYRDIVYNVLLSGQEARFAEPIDRFIYERALKSGEEILKRCFVDEDKFIEELRGNPKI